MAPHMKLWPRHLTTRFLHVQVLQLYAPMAHALGLGPLSSKMDDISLGVLFPGETETMSAWLKAQRERTEPLLQSASRGLAAILAADPELRRLRARATVTTRSKSLLSTMKKLLSLTDFARGGRAPEQVYDVLGMRVILAPDMRTDTCADDANAADAANAADKATAADATAHITAHKLEASSGAGAARMSARDSSLETTSLGTSRDAEQLGSDGQRGASSSATEGAEGSDSEAQRLREACYRVESLVLQQWPMVAERRKDYIAEPKTNGYQSLHLSLELESAGCAAEEAGGDSEGAHARTLCELQIRTQQMHDAAERGDAAHFAYKGGLEPRQADGLKKWTTALQAVRTCSFVCSALSALYCLLGSVVCSGTT